MRVPNVPVVAECEPSCAGGGWGGDHWPVCWPGPTTTTAAQHRQRSRRGVELQRSVGDLSCPRYNIQHHRSRHSATRTVFTRPQLLHPASWRRGGCSTEECPQSRVCPPSSIPRRWDHDPVPCSTFSTAVGSKSTFIALHILIFMACKPFLCEIFCLSRVWCSVGARWRGVRPLLPQCNCQFAFRPILIFITLCPAEWSATGPQGQAQLCYTCSHIVLSRGHIWIGHKFKILLIYRYLQEVSKGIK